MRTRVLMVAAIAIALLTAAAPAPLRNELGYLYSDAPWTFAFPRDHAAHPSFQTEWWYYTGHLDAESRTFGYELTFFRVGLDPARRASPSAWAPHTILFAHFALSDLDGKKFLWDERVARPALGMAGADSTEYRVWIDDWSAGLEADRATHRLKARNEKFAIDLALRSDQPPAIHGRGGVSRKSSGVGESSHYYSMPRLASEGTVTLDGRTYPVRGLTWMDHEFGSGRLAASLSGWDWFSLQLDDGRSLMLYLLRRKGGGYDPASSGTLIESGGRTRHLPLDAFETRSTKTWKSPKTGATYPSGWIVRVPSAALELEIIPALADQELVTGGAVGVVYWEGAVRATGAAGGKPIRGRGYVELTGYTGRAPGL
jgi:predicted secreted hydrolase